MNFNDYDKERFSHYLSNSFVADPFFSFLSSDINVQSRVAALLIDMLLYSEDGEAIVDSTGTDLEGGAIWLDLRKGKKTPIFKSISFYIRLIFTGCFVKFLGILSPLGSMIKHQRVLYRKSDYYLSFLFVRPEYRGKGMASKLLHPMFEKFDKEGLVCSVDTFTLKNVEMYKGYGFKIVTTVQIANNVVNYQMTRDPQSMA